MSWDAYDFLDVGVLNTHFKVERWENQMRLFDVNTN
jgi:hypothetical protein